MRWGANGETTRRKGGARLATAFGLSGFGFLVALDLLLVHRSSPFVLELGLSAWAPFVFGFFGGLGACGIVLALRGARQPFGVGARATMGAGQVATALVAALCLAAGLFSATASRSLGVELAVFGSTWSFGGVLAGAATATLLALWSLRYGALSLRDAFVATGSSCLVAAALSALAVAVPTAASALAGMEILAAAVLLFVGAPASGPSITAQADDSPGAALADARIEAAGDVCSDACSDAHPDGFGKRAAALARAVWKPVVGALICVLVFGFTWNTDLLGIRINDGALLALEKVAGFCAAGIVILLFARRVDARDVRAALVNIVLPIMLIVFIVRPYFLDLVVDPIVLGAIGFARELGFALFLMSAWIALVSAPRSHEASPAFGVGAFAALCGAAGLAGLYGLYALGTASSYMGAVLFVVYLVVVVVTTVVERGRVSARDAREIERQGFERFVDARCEDLATRFGLTPRERDIVAYLARGHSYAHIAGELVVSENTVRTHVRNMYRKMGVSSREELLAMIHHA